MSFARDQQIRAIYQAALERPVAERAAFVSRLTGTDQDLRQSVDRLLAEQNATSVGAGGEGIGDAPELAAGTCLGHYRIDAVLGRGGMGTVYRATDTKLQRAVAIKFSAIAAADAEAKRRFRQEAQTASGLNHPHIVTVHDVDELDGRQYIVSEVVDGGTLDDWSAASRRRGWRQCTELLTGVADALELDHELAHGLITVRRIFLERAFDGVAQLLRNVTRQRRRRRVHDALEQLEIVLGLERPASCEQLVEDDTE